MSDHPELCVLEAYVAGESDPDVAEHVSSCPSCQSTTDELQLNLALLPDLKQSARPKGPAIPEVTGYRDLVEIGRGGMGVVYSARQNDPSREVALKVLLGGAYAGPEREMLFEREIRSLARLSHPNIAGLYDAGSTLDGLRYYTMELVPGRRIDRFAAANGLSLTERIELFLPVAEALHCAHLRGVIHRDVKPGNVLVDLEGRPRVLDFGLARLTEDVTQVGRPMEGTLPYMSPEQVGGEPGDLDLRTDVYSLGVLLYQLCTGDLPHDVRNEMPLEAARIISEEEAPRPKGVDADLEAVLLRALAKDREARYDSAGAFAADLERYLAGEPVQARPPSFGYLARRWIARHQGISALAVLLLVTLVGSAIGFSILYWQAAEEAEDERRLSGFTRGIFSQTSWRAEGRRLDLTDLLDEGAEQLDLGAIEDVGSEAELRYSLGHAYNGQEAWVAARKQLVHAQDLIDSDEDLRADIDAELGLALFHLGEVEEARSVLEGVRLPREATVAPTSSRWMAPLILVDIDKRAGDYAGAAARVEEFLARELPEETRGIAHGEYGELLTLLDRHAEAAVAYETAQAHLEAVGRTDHRSYAIFRTGRANALGELGQRDEAIALIEESRDQLTELLGPNSSEVASTIGLLGKLELQTGNYDVAVTYLEEAAAIYRDSGSALQLATSLANLSEGYMRLRRMDEAADAALEAKDLRVAHLEPDEAQVGASFGQLGALRLRQGKLDEAQELLASAAAVLSQHPEYGQSLSVFANLAGLCALRGESAEANDNFAQAVELSRARGGGQSLADLLMNLGTTARDLGRCDEAIEAWQEAHSIYLATANEKHPRVAQVLGNLAACFLDGGEVDQAGEHLARAWPLAQEVLAEGHPVRAGVRVARARWLRATGDEAAGDELDAALATYRARFPQGHHRVAKTLRVRGEWRLEDGDAEGAKRDFEEAAQVFATVFGDDHPDTRAMRERSE